VVQRQEEEEIPQRQEEEIPQRQEEEEVVPRQEEEEVLQRQEEEEVVQRQEEEGQIKQGTATQLQLGDVEGENNEPVKSLSKNTASIYQFRDKMTPKRITMISDSHRLFPDWIVRNIIVAETLAFLITCQ